MSRSVIARQQGDDYQARVFWLHACSLFQPHTKVSRVSFELDSVKAFDDVVVTYASPIRDAHSRDVHTDYFQVKFHVDHSETLTHTSLIDPAAIGATTFSLLERLRDGVREQEGAGARFNLISAWPIHPEDGLRQVVSMHEGEIRLDKLFDGKGPRSLMGKIRKVWRGHLGLAGDEELKQIVSHLRFSPSPFVSLAFTGDNLNHRLIAAGLKPISDDRIGYFYDDFIRKLHARNLNSFDRASLQRECEIEELWLGHPNESDVRIAIGVRSYRRFAEYLENETEHLLCVADHFDGRRLKTGSGWDETVRSLAHDFLRAKFLRGSRYVLHLDAHTSLALLAGAVLDSKAGIDVALVQRGAGGSAIWRPALDPPCLDEVISSNLKKMDSPGDELAVALGVSNPISDAVEAFVKSSLPSVGRILAIEPLPRPGQTAVRDATHAFRMAEAVKDCIRSHRGASCGIVHLFTSAPNSLLFYLGQMASWLGKIQAYEYHFGESPENCYEPTLTLPISP